MACLMVYCVYLVFLFSFSSGLPSDLPVQPDPALSPVELFSRTLDAVSLILSFFKDNKREMSLDGLVGIRILEVHLEFLLSNQKRGQCAIPPRFAKKVKDSLETAQYLETEGRRFAEDNQPSYFQNIGQLTDKWCWVVNDTTRYLNHPIGAVELWTTSSDQFTRFTDKCMNKVFHSTQEKCLLDRICWINLMDRSFQRYTLTHQLLIIMLAQNGNCSEYLRDKLPQYGYDSVYDVYEDMCNRVYSESESVEIHHDYIGEMRDLFAEQIAFCGMLGYKDFYKKKWLLKILEWQRPNGSFGSTELYIRLNIPVPQRIGPSFIPGGNLTRMKRMETLMGKDGVTHETTVNAGALGVFLRFLADELNYIC